MADSGNSWYREYRPSTIDEYAGARIRELVRKRFNGNRIEYPHTIFIKGTRGCGKTTLARILSKYYLCENPNEDGTPCEKCEACNQINEVLITGENATTECYGVTEVDATRANGKEDMQNIMEDAMLEPIYGGMKYVLFDEVHMVSSAGQNSLLKLIEDIPKHLVVVFATTDPDKVLDTIKSRCQLTVEVRKQSVDEMADRLEVIAKKEGLRYSKEALKIIAKRGDKVPRECINSLEAVAKTSEYVVSNETVNAYFGDVSETRYIDFFRSAQSGLIESVKFVNSLYDDEVNMQDFINGLSKFIIDCINIKAGINTEEANENYIKSIKKLFEIYKVSEFDTLFMIMEKIIHDFRKDSDNNNKIILINNMLRIGKIESFFNKEKDNLVEESKISLSEASKMNEYDIEKAIESSNRIVNLESFVDKEEDIGLVVESDDSKYEIDKGLLEKVSKGFIDNQEEDDSDSDGEDILDKL